MPGRASKWKAGEELIAKLEAIHAQEVAVVSEQEEKEVVEGKEEGESILYGHAQDVLLLDEFTIEQKASCTVKSPSPTPGLGQSTDPQSFLEAFGIWNLIPKPRFAGFSTSNYRMAA